MIVVIGAIAILGGLVFALWSGRLPRYYWRLFFIGVAVGLCWEFLFTYSGMGYPILAGGAANPAGQDLSDLPNYIIVPILFLTAIWDGGLFVVGLVIARLILGAGIELKFSWAALIIMQLWGQTQSFVIETYAINNGMWAYAATPLNPKLFDWGEAQITLVPQLVWFAGYFVFYWAALKIIQRQRITQQQARG